ncbi:hypothetical protein AB0M39_02395 [Streptomyces sp. NPDC051907]|uniref:hypothetical protein n=1 Tax=Streptomyces sp. NPDC051907 TaxID=3155284 RepID=UPI0034426101
MIEQASRIDKNCTQCGNPCEGWVVQLIKNKRLRWESEWACSRCGNSHDGDWGAAPAIIRDRLLAEHGHYRLLVTNETASNGRILKAFRDGFNVSLQEAKQASEKARTDGYEGTYVEVALVKQLLSLAGVATDMEFSDRELISRMREHGLVALECELPSTIPAPLDAILSVTGGYVTPTVAVPHSAPNLAAEMDRHWLEQATRLGLVSADCRFLLRLSDPGSESRGWIYVRDEVIANLPSRIAAATGRREFIALSQDGRHLCAVSIEDDEDWIVTHEFS